MPGRSAATAIAALTLLALPVSAHAAEWEFGGTQGLRSTPIHATGCPAACEHHPQVHPAVAAASDGTTVVVYGRYDAGASTSQLWSSVRPLVGGMDNVGQPLSSAVAGGGTAFSDLDVAATGSGEVLAVWTQTDEAGTHVMSARLAPGAPSFSAPVPLSTDGDDVAAPRLAVGAAGDALVAWVMTVSPTDHVVEIARRPAGSTAFYPKAPLETAVELAPEVDVAVAPSGAAVVAYTTGTSADPRVVAKARPDGAGAFAAVGGLTAAEDRTEPDIDMPADGSAALAFTSDAGLPGARVQVALRGPSGDFAAPGPVSPDGGQAGRITVTDAGEVVVAWSRTVGGKPAVEAARHPAGGSWSSLGTVLDSADGVKLDAMPGGRVVLVAIDPANYTRGRTLAPGAPAFDTSGLGITSGVFLQGIDLAVDGQGDAIATWHVVGPGATREGNEGVELAVFDAAPPALQAVSIPTTGVTGETLTFAATYRDVWSWPNVVWDFAGTPALGAPFPLVFTTAGTKNVSVRAEDQHGNVSGTTAGTVQIAQAPDTTAPVLSSLSVTNKTFRVSARRTAIAATAKKGTAFRFKLSEPAKVSIAIERSTRGRRKGSKCVAETQRNRKAKACVRWVKAGRVLTRTSKAGPSSVPFSGRIGTKALAPGSYRARLVATDVAKNASPAKTLTFKVVRR
jgi:hypothetical protein